MSVEKTFCYCFMIFYDVDLVDTQLMGKKLLQIYQCYIKYACTFYKMIDIIKITKKINNHEAQCEVCGIKKKQIRKKSALKL